jgi:hypothetical protein
VICEFRSIQTYANELLSVSWSIAREVDGRSCLPADMFLPKGESYLTCTLV